jgi:hypothetical protein
MVPAHSRDCYGARTILSPPYPSLSLDSFLRCALGRVSPQVFDIEADPTSVRRVVVATNIAETSVTIPNIVHVIDCGFAKVRISLDNPCACLPSMPFSFIASPFPREFFL